MQDVLITGPRKKQPKMLAYVDKGKCFGRGCEFCINVCPVKDCITMEAVDTDRPYVTWPEHPKNTVHKAAE